MYGFTFLVGIMLCVTFLLACLTYTVSASKQCSLSLTQSLPDSSFLASASYTNSEDQFRYGAHRARMESVAGDNAAGAWVAMNAAPDQYLQIDLLKESVIVFIRTKGRDVDLTTGCCQHYVTSYYVQTSMDKQTWTTAASAAGKTLFNGNNNNDEVVENKLGCVVLARYVRIFPQKWTGHIAMRVDIRGCHLQLDPPPMPNINPVVDSLSVSQGLRPHPNDFRGDESQLLLDNGSGVDTISPWQHQIDQNNPIQPNQNPLPENDQNNQGRLFQTNPNSSPLDPVPQDNSNHWMIRNWRSYYLQHPDQVPWKRTNWGDNHPFSLNATPKLYGPTGLMSRTLRTNQQGVIAPKKNNRCIETCVNRADGDYQSCRSCFVYISCSNGNTFNMRPCPQDLVWNDDKKICDWVSPTCS